MAEENKNTSTEIKAKEEPVLVEEKDVDEDKAIDFEGAKALSNEEWHKEPWYVSLGNGILNFLVKIGLWAFGFLIDFIKVFFQIIGGFFFGIYKIFAGLYRGIRKQVRMFKEMDLWGRLNFLVQGAGPAKYGQLVDGIIFFVIEIAFIVFMVVAGGSNIVNLFNLNPGKEIAENGDSHIRLINGILAIIVCIGYLVVYFKGNKAAYDDYQILHSLEFINARENALYVFNNIEEFDGDGWNIRKASKLKIAKVMRNKYGFDKLSSYYISYAPWNKLNGKDNPILALYDKIMRKIYVKYCGWRDKAKAGRWATALSDFMQWKLLPRKKKSGPEFVKNEIETGIVVYNHTFNKYNDYYVVTRDSSAKLRAYEDLDEFLRCAFAEDKVSIENNIAPLPHNKKVKAKEALSRIVGRFEVSFDVAKVLSKVLAKAVNSNLGNEEMMMEALRIEKDKEQAFHDDFVRSNRTESIAEGNGLIKVYGEYKANEQYLEQGKKPFLAHMGEAYGLKERNASLVYEDYAYAHKVASDESEASAILALRGKRFESYAAKLKEKAFHGKTLTFKKEAKQYTDEKFATTVMALPTLGAIVTSVLPLVFSILIAFTNWDGKHTDNRFEWNLDAWKLVFGLGGGNFVTIFMLLLRWTIVWAIFATFTNYIAGIILALIINKKGIRFKGFWRTCFVITIAIPQFITLLVISNLFSADGPLNTQLNNIFGWKIPFLSTITNGTQLFKLDENYTFIKMVIIILNMWVGVPFTMLSTSGILMNIPEDLYESAQIDGANAWTRFWKITVPYILFVTGPSLLTTFIGNINNFNVIYFLSGGGPNIIEMQGETYNAGHTDLLITWLYKLTVDKNPAERAMGSVIGCLMFAICGFFSLVMYGRMGSVKNEEEFQ